MSLATIHTRALAGVSATPVEVEVHLSGGLPALAIVGLPEAAVKESKDRVRAALINANFDFPARRITVNLAPADLPKEGGRYDLPIALGILAASGQIPRDALAGYEFVGELALSGQLRAVRGALPTALAARESDRKLVLPQDNGAEAALSGAEVLVAESLLGVCQHFCGDEPLLRAQTDPHLSSLQVPDLADVRGQFHAKRALEVAAAGAHNLLFSGPPGTGKSMLASRLPGILPPMSEAEALEVAAVTSVGCGAFDAACWGQRPFRAPHHTASGVALVGGGSNPRPGEISLAHRGVLFLDELPEFERAVLDVLREPLETGRIVISRAARQAEFPARFQLVAAMNPCPCGEFGAAGGSCRCTPEQVARYRSRLSGPFLDRIDVQVEVPRVELAALASKVPDGEPSAAVRERVGAARRRMMDRAGCANAELGAAEVARDCVLGDAEQAIINQAVERLGLSARAYHRVLKVARTVADLDASEAIAAGHLAEALGYRALDRRSG